nr:hypothetical protein [Candidatus Dependentiae bacterium]
KFDSIKKEITLNQNVFFKFFNSNFIKYSAAVIIILFLPVILVVNSGKKNIENYSVNKKTDIQLTNVTVNHQGGETKINYTEFSDMESEINQLKSDMDNFMSNIITEVSYNEEI